MRRSADAGMAGARLLNTDGTLREAGGIVTRLDGSADVLGHGSLLAGNPSVHAALGDLVRRAAESTDTIGA